MAPDPHRTAYVGGDGAVGYESLSVTRGTPTAGDAAVGQSLPSTIRRRDGHEQVTYGGWPLYYGELDTRPGDTEGRDVEEDGATWYPVAPRGGRSGGQERTLAAAGRRRS
jgi:hypothetical protein